MPTYEYECAHCGRDFEAFQRMSDPPLGKCPHCRSKRVRRKLGAGAGIIFKGSGFYETDYRHGKDYHEAAKKDRESPPQAKSEAKSDGKSDGKSKSGEKAKGGSDGKLAKAGS